MSRFENYYDATLLLEKVSKKEIDEALKNKNKLIGEEWEFLMDEFEGVNQQGLEYAQSDWDEFERDVDSAKSQYEQIQDEMHEEQQEIDSLKEDLDTAESERDDYEEQMGTEEENRDEAQGEVDRLEAEIEALTSEMDDLEDDGDKAEMETDIGALGYDLDEAEKFLDTMQAQYDTMERLHRQAEGTVEVLESNISDKESELENRQDYYLDEIDWPSMGSDYINFMEDIGYGSAEIDTFDIVVEDGDLPESPSYVIPEQGGDVNAESIENHMDNNGMLNDAPFDKYEFGEYGKVTQKVGSKTWAIEPDSSVEGGAEVKSPPMELPKFMKMLPDMLSWIEKYGSTDSSTGMHVHMSIKGVKSLTNELNRLKMIMFMDEGWIWKFFEDRMSNSYVQSVKDKLKSGGTIEDKDTKKIFNNKKIALKLATTHFDAISFQSADKGHVEYRYLGGNGYEYKEKELSAAIGMFAHNLSLGYDSEYKKKEYHTKLQRVFNKMELFELEWKRDRMLTAIQDVQSLLLGSEVKRINKLIKTMGVKIKVLKGLYKLDTKTSGLLRRNGEYMFSIWNDYKKDLSFLDGSGKVNMKAYKY